MLEYFVVFRLDETPEPVQLYQSALDFFEHKGFNMESNYGENGYIIKNFSTGERRSLVLNVKPLRFHGEVLLL